VQTDARQHLFDPPLAIKAAEGLNFVQQLVVALQFALQGLTFKGAQPLATGLVLAQRGAQLDQPGLDEGPHRGAALHLRPLLHMAHPRPFADRDLAPVGGVLANEEAQDRGLATPVAADETDLLAWVEPEGGAGEHLVGTEVLFDPFEDHE